MSSGFDIQSLMSGMGGGGMGASPTGAPGQMSGGMQPEPPQELQQEAKTDPIQLLTDALKMVRQATDAEQDPQMSVQLEQISTLLQKAIASDHADTLGSLGMKPGMMRTLSKAS